MQHGAYRTNYYTERAGAYTEPEPCEFGVKIEPPTRGAAAAPVSPCEANKSKAVKILDLCASEGRVNKIASKTRTERAGIPKLRKQRPSYARAYRCSAQIEINIIKLRLEIQDKDDELEELREKESRWLCKLTKARSRAELLRAARSPGFCNLPCAGEKRGHESSPSAMSISPSPCKRAKVYSPPL